MGKRRRHKNGAEQANHQHAKKTPEQREADRQARLDKQAAKDADAVANLPEQIHGIPLVEMDYTRQSKKHIKEMRRNFNSIRRDFLKNLAENNKPELVAAGVTEKQLEAFEKGQCPNDWTVHHKLPLAGGGKNEFSNFLLIRHKPHDDLHGKIFECQMRGMVVGEVRKLKIPYTDAAVHNNNGNSGRLSRQQLATLKAMQGRS